MGKNTNKLHKKTIGLLLILILIWPAREAWEWLGRETGLNPPTLLLPNSRHSASIGLAIESLTTSTLVKSPVNQTMPIDRIISTTSSLPLNIINHLPSSALTQSEQTLNASSISFPSISPGFGGGGTGSSIVPETLNPDVKPTTDGSNLLDEITCPIIP